MAPLGPFERSPRLAVAVSGGADSLALCLLAADWARTRGGTVTALTVDHRLRDGSGDEARCVGGWLAARGIAQEILLRPGARPTSRIQERARAARLALMTAWCRNAGVLHLLLGHHRRDQAETLLMRAARGGGVRGRTGMAAAVETPAVRLLRPLLAVPPERLRAILAAARQPWIEDPSNRDPRHERVRARAALARGEDGRGLLEEAGSWGRIDAELETETRRALARACSFHPAGFALVDRRFAVEDSPAARRALSRLLTTIGGRTYAPPTDKLDRLAADLASTKGRAGATLSGCRVTARGDRLLICRENRGLPEPVVPVPGERLDWDGRFAIDIRAGAGADGRLVALGERGRLNVAASGQSFERCGVPAPVWPTLPAVADDRGVREVPHLGYRRCDVAANATRVVRAVFCPHQPLTFLGSFIADPKSATM